MAEHSSNAVFAFQNWEIDLANRELRQSGAPVPVGDRALEIAGLLAEVSGDTVGKYDLMDRIWPGAVVTENTLQFHISALRKALGRDRGLLKTIFGRGYRLLGEWAPREADLGAGAFVGGQLGNPPAAPSNNLPAATTPLIGRTVAMQDLRDCLSAYRIVSLTGMGGVGKTTLAIEVARGSSAISRDGVSLVELASISDPELVATAVARSLGLRLGGDHVSALSIAQSIGRKQVLLVLDNCEHVIEAAAGLVETLARACPEASILTTSREPLRIAGEYVYRLPPLDLPENGSQDPLRYGSIQLFVARAGDRSIHASQEDLSTIASICQRLDGIPLAIEFAAARASTLGIEHVSRRLEDRFNLLSGTRRTGLARHRTLRATLDWSYELLSVTEQRFLRNLAVFPGGISLEAAYAVARANEIEDPEETISELVWKSFLTLQEGAGGPRWRLLETTRAYVFEKLAQSGEVVSARHMHAAFFRTLFAPEEGGQLVTMIELPRYVSEIDNVRAALDWALSGEGDSETGVALAAAYAPVWLDLTLLAECRGRTEKAQSLLASGSRLSEPLRVQLLTVLGLVQCYAGAASDKTATFLSETLAIAQRREDAEAQLQALYARWTYEFMTGQNRASQDVAQRILSIARGTGDPADRHVGERLLGSTSHYAGDQREAQRRLESVLFGEVDSRGRQRAMWFHHGGEVFPKARLARTLWMRGLSNEAISLAKASLKEAREIGRRQAVCIALMEAVCPIHLMAGDIAASAHYTAMLSEFANGSMFARLARCFRGALEIKCGNAPEGLELLQSSLDEFGRASPLGEAECITDFSKPHGSGFASYYAEALICLGNLAGADRVIDRAIAKSQERGILWHLPELMRMKAELLLARHGAEANASANDALWDAYRLAETQGAEFWRLRTAMSLAELKASQGCAPDASSILGRVCERYALADDFVDLRTARQLLRTFAAVP